MLSIIKTHTPDGWPLAAPTIYATGWSSDEPAPGDFTARAMFNGLDAAGHEVYRYELDVVTCPHVGHASDTECTWYSDYATWARAVLAQAQRIGADVNRDTIGD